eukprot:2856912-Pyramimonas_sp.AAC.1
MLFTPTLPGSETRRSRTSIGRIICARNADATVRGRGRGRGRKRCARLKLCLIVRGIGSGTPAGVGPRAAESGVYV